MKSPIVINALLLLLFLSLLGYVVATQRWTGYVYVGGYEPKHKLIIGRFLFLQDCRDAAQSRVKGACGPWFYECGLHCQDGRCDEVSQ